MKATLIKNLDVVPMTKYDYRILMKRVAHVEYKREKGFLIKSLNHIWLSEDTFFEYFKLMDEN
jgi:hypothetical protein